jgi:hypothetical protein
MDKIAANQKSKLLSVNGKISLKTSRFFNQEMLKDVKMRFKFQ